MSFSKLASLLAIVLAALSCLQAPLAQLSGCYEPTRQSQQDEDEEEAGDELDVELDEDDDDHKGKVQLHQAGPPTGLIDVAARNVRTTLAGRPRTSAAHATPPVAVPLRC